MVEPRLPWSRYQEPEKRISTGELFESAIVPEMEGFTVVKKWTFAYSDGDFETVITRERKQ